MENGNEEMYKKKKGEGQDVCLLIVKYNAELTVIQKEASSQGSKYSAIFQCCHARRFLEMILQLSPHFQATKYLQLAGLVLITDIHGEVSITILLYYLNKTAVTMKIDH